MKVLIVANYNNGRFSPWLMEQEEALRKRGIDFDFYGVRGKGVRGYLANLKELKAKIREYRPDLIHAHYGLSGLLANLQRKVPVATTYHGSDIHSSRYILMYSRLSLLLSKHNIFVSDTLRRLSGYRGRRYSIIPCGIDMHTFIPCDKGEARNALGWSENGVYVIFAGAFETEVKNAPLAQQSIETMRKEGENAQLVELKGYTREQMALLLNAADCLLMTSHREGSPQIVKEALACGCPIVSVDVGDVATTIGGVEGCAIAERTPEAIAKALCAITERRQRTNGRQRIAELGLDGDKVAEKIEAIYRRVKGKL